MSVKIRLQRHGRKKLAFFHIVVADARTPRDGRFIEKLGVYNPNTNPATIDLDVNKAVKWLQNGAQPTDTARAILSYKGALYKKHLQVGVTKGAISQEQADEKFNAWWDGKVAKVQGKKDKLASEKANNAEARMKAESKKREDIAAKVAAKLSAAEASTEESTEETTEESTDTPATEETATEETPAAEETAE